MEGVAYMDIFIEYLIKQKRSSKTKALMVLTISGAVILEIVAAFFLLMAPKLSFFIFLLMVGVIYGAWYVMKYFNVEYEYIVTNGEMDVDKIIAQSKRKRVTTVNFKSMEIMAPVGGQHKREFENQSIPKTIDASVSPNEKGSYFIVTRTEKLGMLKLIFTPDDRIIKSAQYSAPRKVFTD